MKTKFTLHLSEEVHRALKYAAIDQKTTMGGLMEEVLVQHLLGSKNPLVLDLLASGQAIAS